MKHRLQVRVVGLAVLAQLVCFSFRTTSSFTSLLAVVGRSGSRVLPEVLRDRVALHAIGLARAAADLRRGGQARVARGRRARSSKATARRSCARSRSRPATSTSALVRGDVPRPAASSPSATSASPRWSRSATRSTPSRPATSSASRSRSPAASAAAAAAGRPATASRSSRLSTYGLPLGPDYGGFVSDAVARPVRRRDAGRGARRDRAGGGREPLRQHPRRLAHGRAAARGRARGAGPDLRRGRLDRALRGRRSRSPLGAERVDFAGGRPFERELAAAARREPARRGVPEAARPLPDHGRRQRPPAGPRLRAALDRARRHLHLDRDLLRARDAGAAARDVHEGDPLPHRPRPRPPGDGADPRAGPRPAASSRSWSPARPRPGTTPPRPSPATAASS